MFNEADFLYVSQKGILIVAFELIARGFFLLLHTSCLCRLIVVKKKKSEDCTITVSVAFILSYNVTVLFFSVDELLPNSFFYQLLGVRCA